MTLKEVFSGYTLTGGQNRLIQELEIFLSDGSTCFLLKGYAGTGKTFMMKGLTEFFAANKRSFRIAAPTGRAAKVISQKSKHKAYTIHKTIYSSKDLKEFKIKDEDGSETFKFYYELKNNEDPNNTVYIIDESSMLSDVYSEGEFFRFGSGFLLKDLLRYINFDNNDHNKKVIFIGDNAQLPPVNMNFSPALDGNYLKTNCSLESREFELTEVIRQKADSGILHNATTLRTSLKANLFNALDINTGFADVRKTKHEELLPTYLKVCNNSIDEETIIVAYSNSLVKDYNDFARNQFFPGQDTIAVRDRIVLVSNNYNYPQMELLNGDFGTVTAVSPANESRQIKLKRKNRKNETIEITVNLAFRDVEIRFTDLEMNRHDIKCKVMENLLYSSHRDLSSDELKALYVDFKIRNAQLRPGTVVFKEAIRSDPYFNALRVKFGYAVTCHKAQGGEWSNVFLNCKTSMGYFNAAYFRWLYTGITRAKQTLFTIDEPHFTIDGSLQISGGAGTTGPDMIVVDSQVLDAELPFDFSAQPEITKYIFLAINDLFKDANVTINNIRHTNFLEHYSFSRGNETVTIRLHYNSQNKVVRIEKPVAATEFTDDIMAKLIQLQDKRIIFAEPETKAPETEFAFDKPFLREFYVTLKSKVEMANLRISNIVHNNFHELYEFKKGGLTATYKFHYDGKGRFKNTEIVWTRTTGLVEEINALLVQN